MRPLYATCLLVGTLAASVAHAEPTEPEAEAARPADEGELDTIVITDRVLGPPETPTTTAVTVGQKELESAEHDDVTRVVAVVPGVQVRGEDGLGLRPNIGIRGTDANRSSKIALLEDGVLFGPAPYSAPAAYYFPMVSRMTELEIVKGGAQVRFGPNALGGAVNLRTAAIPYGWAASGDVAYGMYDYVKAHARGGYGNDKTGYLLEVIHTGSSGFKELDGGGDTGFDKNEVMAKWRLATAPEAELFQQVEVKLGMATETSNETYLGLSDADFRASPYRRYVASELDQMRWQRGQLAIRHTLVTRSEVELHTTFYDHEFSRSWFKFDGLAGADVSSVLADPTSPRNQVYYDVLTGRADSASDDETLLLTDNYRWYSSRGLQLQLLAPLDTGPVHHELEAGARYHYDEANRRHTTESYVMRGSASGLGSLEPTGLAPALTTSNQGSAHALALHLVDEASLGRLTVTPGLRLELVATDFVDALSPEQSNSGTQVGVIPGLGAHYALTGELGVLAGIYRGFGPVAPQGLEPGSALPAPEASTIVEGGGRLALEQTFVELLGFLNAYDNLTSICTESRGCQTDDLDDQFSAGGADVFGFEALVGHSFRAARWVFPARASYTFTRGTFRSDFSSASPEWGDVEAGDELPYLPAHQGGVSLGAERAELVGVDLTGTYATPAREVAGQGEIPEGERTDGYFLLDAALRVRVAGPIWLYLTAKNLADTAVLTSRRPFGARPMAPRWVQVGLKAEL
jgi:Fe(3+) dicitrate transport protein